MRITLVALNGRFTHSCLALFYVRHELRTRLPESAVALRQFTINDPYYATLLKITDANPDTVFFSVYIWNSEYVKRLVHDLVRIAPKLPVVLGGPQAAALAAGGLPAQCTVIGGPVEGLPASFYQDLLAGCLKGEYVAAAGQPFALPYHDSDFSGPLKNRHIYYESSRGCPFSCTYCLSSVERGVQHKDADSVKRELAAMLRHRPRIIRFVDRTFNTELARALDIWRYLVEQPGDIAFHFEIAPDRFDEAMFAFLETVPPGRFQFEIGLQSTNRETLAAVNRRIGTEKALVNIARLAGFDNIHLHVDLILGLPHETEESFRKSFNDVVRQSPHYIQMGLLKVLPDTPIAGAAEQFGMKVCSRPPYEIMATRWMDHAVISRLYWFGECVEAFYNNRFFRAFFRYILKKEPDPFAFFQELRKLCEQQHFFDKAHTQELMSSLLLRLSETRPDQGLLRELLVVDWLRCGHRFLPGHLRDTDLAGLKDRLWKAMPQNHPPLYDYKSRNEFFKQGVFVQLTGEALREVDLNGRHGAGCVCFLPGTAAGVHRHLRTVLLGPVSESGK